ncbi:hypothetical protein GOODEAATRI_025720 [Goodea atripinnis]|uniref:Uncharacterized protein n=1 Tax=Goodea atripinnis TaxID=208336 RepID=A0ABV0NDK3_9TELE
MSMAIREKGMSITGIGISLCPFPPPDLPTVKGAELCFKVMYPFCGQRAARKASAISAASFEVVGLRSFTQVRRSWLRTLKNCSITTTSPICSFVFFFGIIHFSYRSLRRVRSSLGVSLYFTVVARNLAL